MKRTLLLSTLTALLLSHSNIRSAEQTADVQGALAALGLNEPGVEDPSDIQVAPSNSWASSISGFVNSLSKPRTRAAQLMTSGQLKNRTTHDEFNDGLVDLLRVHKVEEDNSYLFREVAFLKAACRDGVTVKLETLEEATRILNKNKAKAEEGLIMARRIAEFQTQRASQLSTKISATSTASLVAAAVQASKAPAQASSSAASGSASSSHSVSRQGSLSLSSSPDRRELGPQLTEELAAAFAVPSSKSSGSPSRRPSNPSLKKRLNAEKKDGHVEDDI